MLQFGVDALDDDDFFTLRYGRLAGHVQWEA